MKTRAVDFDGCHDEAEAKRGEKTSDEIMKNAGRKVVENSPPRIGRSSNSKNLRKKVAVFVGFAGWHPEKP